jgi:histone-arginine methyltransferase CARM1
MVEPKDGLEHAFTYYYGMLIHQQNMLQDHVRTGTYQRAVMENKIDFKDKVIVDVGTGTGLLAIFAAQAGARKVYAVEASNIAEKAVEIVAANGYADVIEVIKGKIEEVDIPEKVDLIISEPMGFMLLHERMLEVFALAREKWGKPNCKMFPTTGTIYIAPFCDRALFKERQDGASFWNQSVYGVSLNALESKAQQQLFAQPIVGYFSPEILLTASGKAATHIIDFSTTTAKGLEVCEEINILLNTAKFSLMAFLMGSWSPLNMRVVKSLVPLLQTNFAVPHETLTMEGEGPSPVPASAGNIFH